VPCDLLGRAKAMDSDFLSAFDWWPTEKRIYLELYYKLLPAESDLEEKGVILLAMIQRGIKQSRQSWQTSKVLDG
jgi:hypothetical protein